MQRLTQLFLILAVLLFEARVAAQAPILIDDDFEFFRPGQGTLHYLMHDEKIAWHSMDFFDYLSENNLEKKREKIFSYFDSLYEPTSLLKINDILQPINRDRFRDLESYRPNFGFSSRPVWYRIKLHYQGNQASKRIIFNMDGFVSDSHFFVVANNNKVINSFRRSFHEPSALKNRYDAGNNTTVPVELSSETRELDFYFMANTTVVPHLLNISLHSEQHIEKSIKSWLPFQWAYAGAAMALLTYNFGIFLISRQKVYIYYVFFVGTTLLIQAQLSGFYFHFYTKNVAIYWSYHYLVFLGIHGIFFVAFAREFLPFSAYPRIDRLTRAAQVIVILVAIAYVTFPPEIMFPFSTLMVFSVVPMIIGPAIWLMIRKEKQAFFYVTAFSIYLIGSSFKALMMHGYLSNIVLLDHIMEIGSLTEALFLSIAMGDKLRTLNFSLREYIDRIEEIIEEKTREIRSIMKHIQQGIFSILPGMRIHEEYSQHLCALVGKTDIAGTDPVRLLSEGSTMNDDDVARMQSAINLSLESPIEFELNENHLPREIEMNGKFLEVDWQAVENQAMRTEKLLVTLRDVTEIKKLRGKAEAHEKEIIKIAEILAVNAEDCQKFFDTSNKLLSDVRSILTSTRPLDTAQLKLIFLCYHTIKGHVRALGFKELTNVIHNAEHLCGHYQSHPNQLSLENLTSDYCLISSVLEDYISIFRDKLGRPPSGTVNLNRDMVFKILDALRMIPHDKRHMWASEEQTLHRYYYKELDKVLRACCEKATALALDLGKQEPYFAINTPSIDIPPHTVDLLQNVLIHLLRNSVDHGLESTDIRLARNKPAQGTITIQSSIEGRKLHLLISDDGQGLNLRKIAEKATEKGILAGLNQDAHTIASAIFHSGFSTAAQLSDISGRGVGLDAVRSMLEAAGGSISIVFTDPQNTRGDSSHVPFHFQITLPNSAWTQSLEQ